MLGAGSFGITYRATDIKLNKDVACKTVRFHVNIKMENKRGYSSYVKEILVMNTMTFIKAKGKLKYL